jgi:cytochrome c oxidase subunit 2
MRKTRARFTAVFVTGSSLALTGCSGPLSTLDPAGPAAASIAQLWWVMLIGATALFALVMALLAWTFLQPGAGANTRPRIWLIGGGLLLPALVLIPLTGYALLTGERLLAHPLAANVLRIDVEARQWQWSFRYPDADGGARVSVNELHIPVDRPVDLRVTSRDVIHSFWVPRLGGKIDAIPGHTNVIRLSASQSGIFHGLCAEFCGTDHTHMNFRVEAHPAEAYEPRLGQLDRDQR